MPSDRLRAALAKPSAPESKLYARRRTELLLEPGVSNSVNAPTADFPYANRWAVPSGRTHSASSRLDEDELIHPF